MHSQNTENEKISQFLTELIEAWNSRDVERIVAFYALDYEGVDVAQASPQHGVQGIRQTVSYYLTAFPDLHFTGEDIIHQADRIALLWTARGTHQGPFMKIPPSQCSITVRGVSMLTLKDNKILRSNYIWDVAGFLRSIGLLPEL
jgi:steroid delta-isomerase-like uncharacterized protein